MPTTATPVTTRPARPLELGDGTLASFDLPKLAAELRGQDEYRRAGVAAVTLARDERATIVLVALRSGASMREHRAPAPGSVVVLAGRVAFLADGHPARTRLGPGALILFAGGLPHAVEGLEDACYLVTIGGRERPHSGA